MLIIFTVLITASVVYDPTTTGFLYSVLPQSWKSWPWFLAFLMEEIRSLAISVAVSTQALQIHVIAFDLVNWNLQQVEHNLLKRYSLNVWKDNI